MPIPTEFCKRKLAQPHGHPFWKMTRRYDDELACELDTNAKQPTKNRQGPRALKALWTRENVLVMTTSPQYLMHL